MIERPCRGASATLAAAFFVGIDLNTRANSLISIRGAND
jgi:hypothetical protein